MENFCILNIPLHNSLVIRICTFFHNCYIVFVAYKVFTHKMSIFHNSFAVLSANCQGLCDFNKRVDVEINYVCADFIGDSITKITSNKGRGPKKITNNYKHINNPNSRQAGLDK